MAVSNYGSSLSCPTPGGMLPVPRRDAVWPAGQAGCHCMTHMPNGNIRTRVLHHADQHPTV